MPLLHLAQADPGYVTIQALQDIAEICEISITEVGSIVGFYTLYYDKPLGRYHIQVCTDLPCALRGADKFLKELCERLGVKVGEPTSDGLFVIDEVMCLAACHRAPMFQVQGGGDLVYHESTTNHRPSKPPWQYWTRCARRQPRSRRTRHERTYASAPPRLP